MVLGLLAFVSWPPTQPFHYARFISREHSPNRSPKAEAAHSSVSFRDSATKVNVRMRTRNQLKRPQASENEDAMKTKHDSESTSRTASEHDSGTLTNKSREAVGRLLKRTNPQGLLRTEKHDGKLLFHEFDGMLNVGSKGNNKQNIKMNVGYDALLDGITTTDTKGKSLAEEKVEEQTLHSASPDKEEGTDDSDWEDGLIPIPDSREHTLATEVTVEFSDSPSSVKRRPIRRASAEDKELAELVHKVHLLCLIARGRLIDSACSDPLIQASLLSLLPKHLLNIAKVPKLTANLLAPLVNWFSRNFYFRGSPVPERSFESSLAYALESHGGSVEEVTALSVALFRALNLTTRFVCILDVASLKPDMDMSECPNNGSTRGETGIFGSSTLMVARPNQVSASPIQLSSNKTSYQEITHKTSPGVVCQTSENNLTCKRTQSKDQLAEGLIDSLACKATNAGAEACPTKKTEGPKRKGDLEFEMHLEMALSATAGAACEGNPSTNLKYVCGTSSDFYSPMKRKKIIKSEESLVSSQGISTAVGSRRVGAPMCWAEVYCGGENMTGKWVHVDAANAIIDGEQKVEAAAVACRKSLRYVVAFAGHGAKDVTRRYCMKWYKISSLRVSPNWWDAVLAPLKELESGATGGLVHLDVNPESASKGLSTSQKCLPDHVSLDRKFSTETSKQHCLDSNAESSAQNSRVATRNSLEDMELETRALTEPLPTNQQAYKNHSLYAIEKWLTKYQILYPRGPILGYCSGHPVYPRICVQMLQTKQRWLREGLQVKANENAAKVVKRSLKLGKIQESESGICDEDGGAGTIELYGKWQMEPLCLPCAVNGVVPKNERGQVDVWSEKCLPPGTVHLRLPRIVPVVKRLEIDFAPAMVGFEFRNGRSLPGFEGVVVCTEFKDAILDAYEEEEEIRRAEEKKRNEMQAISRWYQLLSSILTQQRLKNTYGEGSSSQAPRDIHLRDDLCGAQSPDSREDMQYVGCQQGYLQDSKMDDLLSVHNEDHEHIFLEEDQSFDDESSVRTKRCPCGFSVQVEEL
ncbi:DNA repair protein RAD4 isoform X2 [Macadamia integrifolia]|uniref:DNA repair protein RAD4 isoform X1 n=1 Tax=Macadamia integrifolia TaxID=60698 RepID=UPI001C4E6CA4|nr:DNA repair protein RAD4 isoform X1 [Macadamia integrifolia]XP_042501208.1 DNA repair protein RAD4 isoform X2 [Macadamia integrifolia]